MSCSSASELIVTETSAKLTLQCNQTFGGSTNPAPPVIVDYTHSVAPAFVLVQLCNTSSACTITINANTDDLSDSSPAASVPITLVPGAVTSLTFDSIRTLSVAGTSCTSPPAAGTSGAQPFCCTLVAVVKAFFSLGGEAGSTSNSITVIR